MLSLFLYKLKNRLSEKKRIKARRKVKNQSRHFYCYPVHHQIIMDKNERTHLRGKKSNKSNKKACNIPSGGNSDGDMLIEDDNTWECSVCTYRNSQEAFKCLMCDVCKGTSTRKPRYNHDLVAQQVKKQQIQIHQKLLKSNRSSSDFKDASDSINNSKDTDKVDGRETREGKSRESKESSKTLHRDQDDQESKGKESKGDGKEARETRVKGGKGAHKSSNNKNDEGSDEPGPSVHQHNHHSHVTSNNSNHNQHSLSPNHQHGSPINQTPNKSAKMTKSHENSVKSNKMESKMKIKNIDRTNFLAQAVTVNNVTVIITEFQPKKKAKTTKKTYRQAASKKDKD